MSRLYARRFVDPRNQYRRWIDPRVHTLRLPRAGLTPPRGVGIIARGLTGTGRGIRVR